MQRIQAYWNHSFNPYVTELVCIQAPESPVLFPFRMVITDEESTYESEDAHLMSPLAHAIAKRLLAARFGKFKLVNKITFEGNVIRIHNHQLRWSEQIVDYIETKLAEATVVAFEFVPMPAPAPKAIEQ